MPDKFLWNISDTMKAYQMTELVAQIEIQSGIRSFKLELTAI